MSKYQIQKRIEEYTDLIKNLGLLDCSMWLGSPEGFPLARELTLDALRSEMDRCYINGGLISHWWGKSLSAQAGNDALAALSAALPRGMYTIWTGVPLYPPEPGNLPGNGRPHDRMRVVRLIHEYENVYTDLAGDIFDLCLIESLINTIPDNRILFGSDFPWLDPRSNLARVFMADIADTSKEKILRTNAMYVYKIIDDTP